MKNISIRKFVRIILYCLIYPFGLNTVKSCDITVKNHSLPSQFKQDFLYIFEIYNIFHCLKNCVRCKESKDVSDNPHFKRL